MASAGGQAQRSSNPRIVVRGLDGKRNDFGNHTLHNRRDSSAAWAAPFPVWAGQHFPESKSSGEQWSWRSCIREMNGIHAFRELRMVFIQ